MKEPSGILEYEYRKIRDELLEKQLKMFYEVITWPDVQELMTIDGFRENSYLVNDEKGIEDFGSSAYFVSVDWLEELYNTVTMTEERYQYLNSLSIEDYEKNTTVSEQLAFCEYQQKHHPDEILYCQTCSFD